MGNNFFYNKSFLKLFLSKNHQEKLRYDISTRDTV
jgi:hypothetical protein